MELKLNSTHPFRFCFYQFEPWIITENLKPLKLKGVLGDLFYAVARLFPEFLLLEAKDKSSGKILNNGTWTGSLGMLQRNEAEVSILPLGPTEERILVADFTNPHTYDLLTVLSGRPKDYSYDTQFAIINIFTFQVWMCLICTVSALSVVFYLFRDRNNSDVLYNSLIHCVRPLINQDVKELSRSHGYRVLLTFWLMAAVLIQSVFTGKMLAKLTIRGTPKRINKLTDITDYPELTVIVAKGSVQQGFIEQSLNPLVRKVWTQVVSSGGEQLNDYVYVKENYASTLNGNSVLIGGMKTLRANLLRYESQLCSEGNHFFFAKEPFQSIFLSFAVNKRISKEVLEKINRV